MFSRSARLYDAIYSWKDYQAEAERLHALVQERAPGARTLLDVACGTGAHLAELRRWYEVEGLDLDPALLAVARERLPGVPLHEADMTDFDLGRTFDAVTCLFSSIGYVRTLDRMRVAVAAMTRHVASGVLVIEPWLLRENWLERHVGAVFVDEPELKIARMNAGETRDGMSVLNMHYLVGTPDGVEHFVERHELGLFRDEDYRKAFEAAALTVDYDAEGLMGRGLYFGTLGAR
ncbi:MAG: class I SAM-dependent methyltransferase [Gaiellaceae bacterium]